MASLPGLPSGNHKRYRECMAEVIAVLKKYMEHTPGKDFDPELSN